MERVGRVNNAELEGLFPFEKLSRKSNFYLFNQQLSANHHTEEYLLCTPTSYAIATAKVSRFKMLSLELNSLQTSTKGFRRFVLLDATTTTSKNTP